MSGTCTKFYRLNGVLDGRLTDAILELIAPTEEQAESISFLHRTLREDGWKGLGNLDRFETIVTRLGFVVRQGRNRRNQKRREVTL